MRPLMPCSNVPALVKEMALMPQPIVQIVLHQPPGHLADGAVLWCSQDRPMCEMALASVGDLRVRARVVRGDIGAHRLS